MHCPKMGQLPHVAWKLGKDRYISCNWLGILTFDVGVLVGWVLKSKHINENEISFLLLILTWSVWSWNISLWESLLLYLCQVSSSWQTVYRLQSCSMTSSETQVPVGQLPSQFWLCKRIPISRRIHGGFNFLNFQPDSFVLWLSGPN